MNAEDQIRAIYADFFGREPAKEEVSYWADLLKQGTPIKDVLSGMAGSQEAQDVGVQGIAGLQFGRPEDKKFYETFDKNKDGYLSPNERREFAKATKQEFIPGAKDFASQKDRDFYASFDKDKSGYLSPEEKRYYNEAIGKDASSDQIKKLYKDVFGREADEAGLKYWDESGLGSKDIENEFRKSQEFGESKDASADQIKSLYKDMFGREADEAGLKYWDETGANLQDIRKEFAKSKEGKDLGVEDLAAKSYAKPEDKTFYESFDVNKDKYMSPAEQAAFKKAITDISKPTTPRDDFKVGQPTETMRGDRTGTGVSVTGENSGLRDPYVDYVQRLLERSSAEADVPFQAYTKTPELITQATSGLKNLVTPGQFTSGSNLAQAAGLGALMYGNYKPTEYATGTFSNPFVQGQQPPGKAMGGVINYDNGGAVNVGANSSQQSPYTNNMNYGMGNLQPMQYGGQNVTNVQASYMDPYMQNVTNIAKREAQRASDIAGQREAAQAVSQGAFGGSRYGLVEAERQRNLGQQMSDLDIKGLQAAYQSGLGQFNTEQERALKAQELGEKSRQFGADLGLRGLDTSLKSAQILGNLGQQQSQADLARLKQQYDTGASERTFDYNEFLRGEKYPYENLTFMRTMLQGLPIQAASTGISPNMEAILAALGINAITKPGT